MSFPKNPLASTHRSNTAATDEVTPRGTVRAGLASPATTRPTGPAVQAGSLPGSGATRSPGIAFSGQTLTRTIPAQGQTTTGLGAARTASSAGPSAPGTGALRSTGLTGQSPFGTGAARPSIGQQTGFTRSAPLPPRTGGATTQPSPAARTPSAAFNSSPAAGSAGTLFRKDMQITDEEFLHLRDFIYEQCGIFIAENRKYLVENRLSHRIKELHLKSFNEYYKFLRYDANRQKELTHLFEVITTNETSFFRNPPQLEVFQNIVLPEVLDRQRKSGNKRLRIWSAGCSTGEEPYTLAIIISEVLKGELSSWDVAINAYDLSEAVLAAARRGVYNAYSLRTTPKDIVARYFTQDGNQYTVKPELKRLIRFNPINLNDKEQCKRVEKSQIVFCRNVIIYFDDAMKRRVINAFYDNLEPQGVLLIGHSETLHNISRAFQLEHHTGTIVYRKAN
ncbi:MAG: chemotaxis protein CheR [Desulfovibrio sp.]|nr:chemotaxis protein CheR [Desulfovibrio sp.]